MRTPLHSRPLRSRILAAALALSGCAEGPADGDPDPQGPPDAETWWVLYEDDGSPTLPERARGTDVTVSSDQTRIDFTGATPEGWSAQMISADGFPAPGDSTDDTLTATLTSPTASCTITPSSADSDDYALTNLVFLDGVPAGQLTVITTCDGFDEPDEPVEVPRTWTLSFAPPA